MAPRPADGEARGHFAPAGGGAREHEAGDVGAADDQHHEHGAPGEEQLGAGVRSERFLQGNDALFEIFVLFGKAGCFS